MNFKKSIAICVLAIGVSAAGQAELILSDDCNVGGGNSPGTGFGLDGPSAGLNYQITNRLAGSAAAGLDYFATLTTKAASSYSISTNRMRVAAAVNSGRFTLTENRVNPFDFGAALGSDNANPAAPVNYELAIKMSNGSSGTQRASFGIAVADDGIQNWDLGIQLVNNGANLEVYRRVDSASNASGTDYNDVMATLAGKAGQEVDLRIRFADAGSEFTGFNSSYEIFADDTLIFSSAPGDFRFHGSAARLILFDIASNTGPVTYDALSLDLITTTNPPASTNGPLKIISNRMTSAGLELEWASKAGTNYTVLKSTNLASHFWQLVTNVTAGGTNTTVAAAIDSTIPGYYRVAQLDHSGLTLTNVVASQRPGSGLVDIHYDLADIYAGHASISVLISTNGGQTYNVPAASFSGDVGNGVNPGANCHIVWDAGADWTSLSAANVRVKIIADRAPIRPDMALIPEGTFTMGDARAEGLSSELPLHVVNLSAFYAHRYEVTRALWDDVMLWATNHGYTFENPGFAIASNHPIQQVSWFDAVKWCNARSEKEGLAPAYFTDPAWTTVYRTGEVNLTEANVRWHGAGYRLPTEAEWEKAARGGLAAKRFSFGDTIAQSQANYWSTEFESFDVNVAKGPHPLAPEFPNVLPVGSFPPTGYGLYDMTGNSWEWCWDYYGDAWYADGRAALADTRGPSAASWGGDRVYRGGSGVDIAWKSRVANRADAPPRFAMGHFGFRVVLPAGEHLVSAESSVFTFAP